MRVNVWVLIGLSQKNPGSGAAGDEFIVLAPMLMHMDGAARGRPFRHGFFHAEKGAVVPPFSNSPLTSSPARAQVRLNYLPSQLKCLPINRDDPLIAVSLDEGASPLYLTMRLPCSGGAYRAGHCGRALYAADLNRIEIGDL